MRMAPLLNLNRTTRERCSLTTCFASCPYSSRCSEMGLWWQPQERKPKTKTESDWTPLLFWRARQDVRTSVCAHIRYTCLSANRKPWYLLAQIQGSSSSCTREQNEEHLQMFLVLLARPAGFEPATYRFVAGHSIH